MLSSRILVEGNYKMETIGQPKLNVCSNSNLQNTVFSYTVTCGIKGCVKVHFLSTLEQFGMLIRNIWLVSNELQQWQSETKTTKLRLEVSRKFLYPPSPFLPKKAKAYHTTLSLLIIGLWSDRISIYIFRLHFVRMAQSIKCVVVGDGAVGAYLISIWIFSLSYFIEYGK